MIPLGATVTDKITGFRGTVTGYVRYLSGCNQALVVPRCKEDGALNDAQWFDEQRLVIDNEAPLIALDNAVGNGPDKAAPKR